MREATRTANMTDHYRCVSQIFLKFPDFFKKAQKVNKNSTDHVRHCSEKR